jgi:hypothetical protein
MRPSERIGMNDNERIRFTQSQLSRGRDRLQLVAISNLEAAIRELRRIDEPQLTVMVEQVVQDLGRIANNLRRIENELGGTEP